MTDDRRGGYALIAGTVALLMTMIAHPTGSQLLHAGDRFAAVTLLNTAVHTLALVAVPVLFLGAIALTTRLNSPNRLAVAGIVFYGIALITGLCAGALSGFVAPDVLRSLAKSTSPQAQETWRVLFRYTGILNQAFARILVVGTAIAIICWSAAMRTHHLLRMFGLVSSVITIVLVMTGLLRLGVHGYGAVVLVQSVWFVCIAGLLMGARFATAGHGSELER